MSHITKNNMLNIKPFNQNDEYMKLFVLKFPKNTIRTDVMMYVINNIKRRIGVFELLKYIPCKNAIDVENGIVEYVMNFISNRDSDCIQFISSIYWDMIKNLCTNLDITNHRINNKTLYYEVINNKVDPHMLAFMTPQQLHPVKWINHINKWNSKNN